MPATSGSLRTAPATTSQTDVAINLHVLKAGRPHQAPDLRRFPLGMLHQVRRHQSCEIDAIDWTILDEPGVDCAKGNGIVQTVARKVSDHRWRLIERGDAEQLGRILLATCADEARDTLSRGSGLLHSWLKQRVNHSAPSGDPIDSVTLQTALEHCQKSCSLDAIGEMAADGAITLSGVMSRGARLVYSPRSVEELLPLLWRDRGIPAQAPPDPTLLRQTVDGSTTHTTWAVVADLSIAWKRAPLTAKQKRALFMRYALDWEYVEIGRHEGVSKQSVNERVQRGLAAIASWLNEDGHDGDNLSCEDVAA